jgi:predicted component of type VI protein secretion system
MQGPRQDADRESLQRLPVEDLLLRLLGGAHSDSLDAVQWLRELFGMARAHDVAMMRALRSALADFIQRLEPKSLGSGRALAERFRNLTDMPDGQLPHLFGEALARSFEAEIQHPSI